MARILLFGELFSIDGIDLFDLDLENNVFLIGHTVEQNDGFVQHVVTPQITFSVNLWPLNEQPLNNHGPIPNDLAVLNQRTIQIPGVSGNLVHGDTFILSGQQSVDLMNQLSTGNINDAFSKPLIITNIT